MACKKICQLCSGCCTKIRPKWSQHVHALYPDINDDKQDEVRNLGALTSYGDVKPKKLPDIARSLVKNIEEDLAKSRLGRVKISMTALGALVETNHGDERLTYYDDYVTQAVTLTMADTHDIIRIASCRLLATLVSFQDSDSDSHRYDPFFTRLVTFAALRTAEQKDEPLRVAALRALIELIKSSDSRYLHPHYDTLVPAILSNLPSNFDINRRHTADSKEGGNIARADDTALECMALLAFKTTLPSITSFLRPVFRYLDDYDWPLKFAVRCFLVLADKTGLPSGDILCTEIIKHMDSFDGRRGNGSDGKDTTTALKTRVLLSLPELVTQMQTTLGPWKDCVAALLYRLDTIYSNYGMSKEWTEFAEATLSTLIAFGSKLDGGQETLDLLEHICTCMLPPPPSLSSSSSSSSALDIPPGITGAARDEAVAMAAMASAGVPGPRPSPHAPTSLASAVENGTLVVVDANVRMVAFRALHSISNNIKSLGERYTMAPSLISKMVACIVSCDTPDMRLHLYRTLHNILLPPLTPRSDDGPKTSRADRVIFDSCQGQIEGCGVNDPYGVLLMPRDKHALYTCIFYELMATHGRLFTRGSSTQPVAYSPLVSTASSPSGKLPSLTLSSSSNNEKSSSTTAATSPVAAPLPLPSLPSLPQLRPAGITATVSSSSDAATPTSTTGGAASSSVWLSQISSVNMEACFALLIAIYSLSHDSSELVNQLPMLLRAHRQCTSRSMPTAITARVRTFFTAYLYIIARLHTRHDDADVRAAAQQIQDYVSSIIERRLSQGEGCADLEITPSMALRATQASDAKRSLYSVDTVEELEPLVRTLMAMAMIPLTSSSSPLTTTFEPLDAKLLYTGGMRDVAEYSVRDRGHELSRLHSSSHSSSRLRSHSTDTNHGGSGIAPTSTSTSSLPTSDIAITVHGDAPSTGDAFDAGAGARSSSDDRKLDSFLSSLPSSHMSHNGNGGGATEMTPLARITIPIVSSSPVPSPSLSSSISLSTSVTGDQLSSSHVPAATGPSSSASSTMDTIDALAVPDPASLVQLHFDQDIHT